jgi:hypothetical protein
MSSEDAWLFPIVGGCVASDFQGFVIIAVVADRFIGAWWTVFDNCLRWGVLGEHAAASVLLHRRSRERVEGEAVFAN